MKLPAGYVEGKGVVKASGFGGVGERLLRGMGWQHGQGLGRAGDGMREALDVKRKDDAAGVGASASVIASEKWGERWWESAFDSAAKAIGGGSGSSSSSSSSSGSDSDSDSDDGGGNGAGGRAAAAANRDGTRSTASADELRLAGRLAKGGRLAAGRFGGRDAKMARIASQEALHAAAAAAALAGGREEAGAAAGSSGSDTTSGPAEARTRGKGAAAAAPAEGADAAAAPPKRPRIVIEPAGCRGADLAATFVPTPAVGWWGAARFASAGCLEGLDRRPPSERAEFTEQQQEGIYTAAQATKAHGKTGLGQGSGALKVGGARWEGSKVTFADAAAEPEAAAAEEPAEEPAASEDPPGWAARVKWRKIVSRALAAAPGRELRLKQLRAAVADAVRARQPGVARAAVRRELAARLEGSSRWEVDGKVVRLK